VIFSGAIIPSDPEEYEYFGRQTMDGQLIQATFKQGQILNPRYLGDTLTAAPAATFRHSGVYDIAFRGANKSLWHKRGDANGWHPAESIGGPLGGGVISSPSIVSLDPNTVDVLVTGADRQLWRKTLGGGSDAWVPLGPHIGSLDSAPSAVSWGPGRLDVFVRNAHNRLLHYWSEGEHHGWEALGHTEATFQYSPSAVSWGLGRLDVFGLSPNGLLHWWYEGGWPSASPESFFAPIDNLVGVPGWDEIWPSPVAVSRGDHQLEVFVGHKTYGLMRMGYDRDHWTPWSQVFPQL